jgi:hypothetical protein
MERTAFEQRVARLTRTMDRAASEIESEARQTALESLASFSRELAEHFAQAERGMLPGPASRDHALHSRLCGDLRALEARARTAGDWPESWSGVKREFTRFVAALAEYERTHQS